MSFLKRPFRKLKEINKNTPTTSTDSVPSKTEGLTNGSSTNTTPSNGTTNGNTPPDSRRQSKEVINQERKRRSLDKERQKFETKKRETLARIEDEKYLLDAPPELTKLYRPYSMNMSKRWNHENRILFKEIDFASKCDNFLEVMHV
jgi:hypothetical protein